MNLKSCDECGVVLDLNKLSFPSTIHNAAGGVDDNKGAWNGSDYVPFVRCPVCQSKILSENRSW